MTKAVDKAKYRAWETVGIEKRDLFKREVGNVKEEQEVHASIQKSQKLKPVISAPEAVNSSPKQSAATVNSMKNF